MMRRYDWRGDSAQFWDMTSSDLAGPEPARDASRSRSPATVWLHRVVANQQDVSITPQSSGGDEPFNHSSHFGRDVRTPSVPAEDRRQSRRQLILADRVNLLNEPDNRFFQFRRRNFMNRPDRLRICSIAASDGGRRLIRQAKEAIGFGYEVTLSSKVA